MKSSSRLTVLFSSLGHLFIHFLTAFFFVIVLALEVDWRLPYHELIELWTVGSLLVGLAALPAGLLSDRVGASRMMAVFFLGMGGASIAAGLAPSPRELMPALAAIGLFAAIYHPVGIPWLVRNSTTSRGKALGLNGVFGTLGSALAGVLTGALIDGFGWRAAFFLPGALCALIGLALVYCIASGRLADAKVDPPPSPATGNRDSGRVFGILVVTMFVAGLIFHSTQTALPKVFELRHQGLVGEGAFGVGALVAIVYGAAGVMQIVGGHLADRMPLKQVYVSAILLQVPMLLLLATFGGIPLVLVATLAVMANAAALPAENLLLARHTSEKRHGLVFGTKFVLSFGAAPLAVQLAALVSERTGEFFWLFVLLGLVALTACLLALFLPGERRLSPATRRLTDPPAVPTME